MPLADTRYQARFSTVEDLEKSRLCVVSCKVELDGNYAPPTAGTVTIFRPDATKLADAQTATCSNGVATYSVAALTTASETLGKGWSIEWALVMPDGVTHTFRNGLNLVRRRLYSPISDRDLWDRYDALDYTRSGYVGRQKSWQPKIVAALTELDRRCRAAGTMPQYMVNPPDVFDYLLNKTLELVFADLSVEVEGLHYAELATKHAKKAEDAWAFLTTQLDKDQDGVPDNGGAMKSVKGSTWLSAAPHQRGRAGRYT